MRLEGSCQCGKVTFRCESETPYPYMYCYCSICRKLQGGFGCNVMGIRKTLRVTGKKHLKLHHAVMREKGRKPYRSEGERWFCGECGTHLYVLDDRWPEGVWPNACALDVDLPEPPEIVHILLDSKANWVPTPGKGPRFGGYPKLGIAEWHEEKGLPRKARRKRR
jgi:hypothetical protein